MDQYIRDRYSDTILQEAMQRYAIAPAAIQPLDAFESFIYEFQRGADAAILRISHSSRRSEDLIHGEMDWINYLADRGVPVARALPSARGKLVETIDDGRGGAFLTTAFVKAAGRPPWEAGWSPTRYATYGQLLGRMHALAHDYRPANPAWTRPEWDDPRMEFVERYLPASETIAKQKYRVVREHVQMLPKDSTSYGLIHQDVHQTNFLMDEAGAITLFDFDECVYSWFINDLAIVLFHSSVEEDDASAFTHAFMPHFLRGYHDYHILAPQWLRELPNFLKLREIELYAVMHRDFDVSTIDDPWCAHFMHDRKQKIEADVPFIDFDFESLAAYL